MDLLGDPWTVLILRELMYGVHRFEQLRENTEAPDRTLADRISRMMDHGLVRREQYAGSSRPRYEYFLTPAGEAARPVLHALAAWGQEHTTEPKLSQRFQLVCPKCNVPTEATATCAACGTDLTASTAAWIRPRLPSEH